MLLLQETQKERRKEKKINKKGHKEDDQTKLNPEMVNLNDNSCMFV